MQTSAQHLDRGLRRSIVASLFGTFTLRIAGTGASTAMALYLAAIDGGRVASADAAHISAHAVGWLGASFLLAELIASAPFGALSDRYGRRTLIIVGCLLGALAALFTGMTTVLWALFLIGFTKGLSAAACVPAILSHLSAVTSHSPGVRRIVVGLFEFATIIGTGMGIFVGGRLWASFHASAFLLIGSLFVVSLIIFMGLGRAGENAPGESHHGLRLKALLNPRILRFAPAWIAVNGTLGVWFNHATFQLSADRGASRFAGQALSASLDGATIGLWLGSIVFLFTAGVVVWSFIGWRWRGVPLSTFMALGAGGVYLVVGTVYALNHELFAAPLVLSGIILAVFVMSAFTPAALAFLADISEDHRQERGAIMGLYSLFLGAGQAGGAIIGGWFAEPAGIDGLLLLTLILGTVAFLAVLPLALRRRPRLQPQPAPALAQVAVEVREPGVPARDL